MKLDTLRRYRAQLEEVAQIELFLLRQELQDAEARSRMLDAQMRQTTDAYQAKAGAESTLEEFLVWQCRCAADTSKLVAAQQVEVRLRESWNQKQDALREAMQDRRKLDQLVQRRRQQRALLQQRVDQMELDEAARRMNVP